ncbi:sushi, von Willebrand factor type A, EGF and pentraxin domain-containing protein 1-like isoform X2 [Ptychodera flava]|uniref:sushi, von Willebrand factor type A, EGF and pentraxin domain-containing protein 1-like isoform X2 n=1 Tax=Ptychodera flava TaxID=63121 RepID=UPI00396A19EA
MNMYLSTIKVFTVLTLLAGVLPWRSDADWCPGGCCDCPVLEPPPCFCDEPPCIQCPLPQPQPQPVVPLDNVPPVFRGCPVNMQRTIPAGRETVSVCWREPSAVDNRAPLHIKPSRQGPRPCTDFREGTHIVSYVATDFAGNTANCQFTITIHAITCTKLLATPYSRITCSNENRQGSVCEYYCDSHYSITEGSKQRVCGADGKWSGTEATCTLRRCEVLMSPVNGRLSCRGGDIPGSTCTYRCSSGYYIASGTETRRCKADGHWSGVEARCEPRQCAQLTAPANGYVSCTGRKPRSVCHFRCDTGYHIDVGSTTRTCSTMGEWTGLSPICLRKDDGCSPLPPPQYGRISCTGNNQPGTWCQYSCNHGYILEGAVTRVCEERGRWTGTEPACYPKSCSILRSPANGRVSCDAHTPGSRCHYSCNTGYSIERGSEYRTCQQSGDWSGTEAVCSRSVCPILHSPHNGYVDCDGTSYGSRCRYQCNRGYSIGSGSATRTCESTGRWSGSEVTCVMNSCSPLLEPLHGYIRCQGNNEVGTTCTYYCDEGFSISTGSQHRECQSSSRSGYDRRPSWSGQEPQCQMRQCTPLTDPDNGYVDCDGRLEEGTRCTYHCNRGYTLEGSSQRRCRRNGNGLSWSGHEPRCTMNGGGGCTPLRTPANGRIRCDGNNEDGSRCTYHCNDGYTLEGGTSQRTCRYHGNRFSWSGSEPICELYTGRGCTPLRDPADGYVRCDGNNDDGARCTYRCDDGYTLKGGTSQRTCRYRDNTFSWLGSEPTCELYTGRGCTPLRGPANGYVRCDGNNEDGSRCTYHCDDGHTLEGGTSQRTCRYHGNRFSWSGSEPTCEPYTGRGCTTLRDPANGYVRCVGYNEDRTRCTYNCNDGYTLEGGTSQRICRYHGNRFSWSGSEPTCERELCERLREFHNVNIRCNGNNELGTMCTYYCNEGFDIVVLGSRECISQGNRLVWSGRELTCKYSGGGYCPTLAIVANMVVQCNTRDLGPGTYCDLVCKPGYLYVMGPKRIFCERNGRWSEDYAKHICKEEVCVALNSVVPNGELMCNSNAKHGAYPISTRCEYRCHGDYEVRPSPSKTVRICRSGGVWDGEAGACHPSNITGRPCSRLRSPDNGRVVCKDENKLFSVCTYSCNNGYKLQGTYMRLCKRDSTWTGSKPVCEEEAGCNKLGSPENGEIYCEGQSVGDRCQYRCLEGYTMLSGTKLRECQANRKWSGAEVVCKEVTCDPLPPPHNGQVVCSNNFKYGCKCDYYCNAGYYATGGSYSRQCSGSGQWTGRPCTCRRIQVRCTQNSCSNRCGYRPCSPRHLRRRKDISLESD